MPIPLSIISSPLLADVDLPPSWSPLDGWLLLVGLFGVGTLFGSFANVVIYRLPLGKSLLWPGSQCPACGHPIRWHDNVPVFGWLLLAGKCRDCRAPIAVRYPAVEALFGVLLASLGWLEVIGQRSNLPFLSDPMIGLPNWGDLLWVAYHFLLIGTLVTAAIIQLDGHRTPRRLIGFALVCGLALPAISGGYENLRPVDFAAPPAALSALHHNAPMWGGRLNNESLLALADGAAGLAAGALLGCLAWPATAHGARPVRPPGLVVLELATIGTFLGWQAACGIALVVVACDLATVVLARAWRPLERIGWPVWLAGMSLAWLVCWSDVVRWAPAFARGDLGLLVVSGAIVAAGALAAWQIGNHIPSTITKGVG